MNMGKPLTTKQPLKNNQLDKCSLRKEAALTFYMIYTEFLCQNIANTSYLPFDS